MSTKRDLRLRDWPLVRSAVGGVGSLPFSNRREAIALIRETCPTAPFVPELPHARDGAFLIESALAPPRVAAIERAIRAIAAPTARLVKMQTCGPGTLARHSGLDVQKAERIVLRNLDAWLGVDVRGRARLVVLDEPSRADRGEDRALARCLARIRDAGAYSGIHCCGSFSIARIARLDPDVLSFDAWHALEVVTRSPSFRRWYARGRAVALGLVPTTCAKLALAPLANRAARALLAAGHRRGESPAPLVTANCGFAASGEDWTKRAFAILGRLAARLEKELARCSSTARISP
jgi:hypothetical protein